MPATIIGNSLNWGMPNEEASLATQSVSVTNKSDKKEVRDAQGYISTVAFYNQTSEISIEGYGDALGLTIGTSLSVNSSSSDIVSTVYIDEVTLDYSNEDFTKSSISATAYSGI